MHASAICLPGFFRACTCLRFWVVGCGRAEQAVEETEPWAGGDQTHPASACDGQTRNGKASSTARVDLRAHWVEGYLVASEVRLQRGLAINEQR